LNHLNLYGPTTSDKLAEFYQTAKAQFPDAYSSYPEKFHIGFLESWGLIASTDANTYSITLEGKNFMQWMAAQGVGPAKPF